MTQIVVGGAAVVVDQLARGLDRNRYEPIVLFETARQSNIRESLSKSNIRTIDLRKCSVKQDSPLANPRTDKGIGRKVETYLGGRARGLYFSLKDFYEFVLRQAPRIRLFLRAIRENKIDLVHTHHNLHFGKPEIIASWIAGVPIVSHFHGYYMFTHFDKMFSRFVDAFIYISKDVAEFHTSQVKPRFKSSIIHNGVNLSEFNKTYDTDSVRAEFDIAPEQPLVGLIGRIDWWKGHEYFLEAMAEISKEAPNASGLIIGPFEENESIDRNREYLNKLHSMVSSLDLQDKIIFTGFRDDVPRLMAALDVVVLATSTREPFGLVVIEGMAAGKPVVATAAGGVLDIIEDGVNGSLVPCKDSKAMAQAILNIIFDKDKADKMGLLARQRVAEKFTVQHQVMAVQNLYDAMLNGSQSQRS